MRAATFLGASLVFAALTAAACQRATQTSQAPDTAAATPQPPKRLTLNYDKTHKPVVGTSIDASAEGLPPNKTVDLVWGTVDGGWVIEDYFHFKGKKYSEVTRPLSKATVDGSGRLNTRFAIPKDFGGVHEIFVRDGDTTLAQGGIEVSQTFEMSPSEGPVGTTIELRVKGLGWRTMESTWVVNWDNREVGYVSATDTRGTAVARKRATALPFVPAAVT